jgi:hypothetical protein
MYRSVLGILLIAAMGSVLVPAACSKKLPSTPGTPPGAPVVLAHLDIRVNASRVVNLQGWVMNRSGYMIYDVRIAMTVYRDDPDFTFFTDTSDVFIASIPNGDSASFPNFPLYGDRFVDAEPLYSLLPPGP